MERKMNVLKVTSTTIYFFEDDEINGWPPEKVIEDWFEKRHLDENHATRDGHHIGNTTIVKKVELLDREQLNEYEKEIKSQAKEIAEKRKPKLYPK